jgi:hypothetical protein
MIARKIIGVIRAKKILAQYPRSQKFDYNLVVIGAGDVVGLYQFTHAASYQVWFAAVNALFRSMKSFKVD